MKFKRILKRRKRIEDDDDEGILSSATVAIELDRPRPLYVAGEAVTGCLVFILPLPGGITDDEEAAEEDYEALAAKASSEDEGEEEEDLTGGIWAVTTLMGSSQCSWKRHRGDTAVAVTSPTSSPTKAHHKQRTAWNRTFWYCQRTLLGNLYETGPQKIRKGSDTIIFADSVDCPSLGEILLPEDTALEEDSPWKLRVCYDDRNQDSKKDMLLKGNTIGEATIDLLQCAATPDDIQSLSLTDAPSTLIVDHHDNEQEEESKNDLVVSEIRVSCGFAGNQMYFKVHSVSFKSPPRKEGMVYVKLWNPSGEVNVENFEYDDDQNPTSLLVTMPFSIPVASFLPASAQLSGFDSRTGRINYWLGAHIQVENEEPQATRQLIYVLARNPIPKPFMLLPTVTSQNEQQITCPRWQGLFPYEIGTVDLKLCLDKRFYSPGEVVHLDGTQVTNHTSERIVIAVSVTRQVQLTAIEGDVVWQETATRQYPLFQKGSIRKYAAKCYQEDTWSFSEAGVELAIPAVTPSFVPGQVRSDNEADYWPVRCSHSIELSATKEGTESSVAKVAIPIFLCALPLSQGAVPSDSPIDVPSQEASAMDTSSMGRYVERTLQVDASHVPVQIENWPEGEPCLNEVWQVIVGESRATFSTTTQILTVQSEGDDHYLDDHFSDGRDGGSGEFEYGDHGGDVHSAESEGMLELGSVEGDNTLKEHGEMAAHDLAHPTEPLDEQTQFLQNGPNIEVDDDSEHDEKSIELAQECSSPHTSEMDSQAKTPPVESLEEEPELLQNGPNIEVDDDSVPDQGGYSLPASDLEGQVEEETGPSSKDPGTEVEKDSCSFQLQVVPKKQESPTVEVSESHVKEGTVLIPNGPNIEVDEDIHSEK